MSESGQLVHGCLGTSIFMLRKTYWKYIKYMGVSKNNGTPKSSILIGFSIINHPFWDTSIFGHTHIDVYSAMAKYKALVNSCNGTFSRENSFHPCKVSRFLKKNFTKSSITKSPPFSGLAFLGFATLSRCKSNKVTQEYSPKWW